jgi:hypothetical protein
MWSVGFRMDDRDQNGEGVFLASNLNRQIKNGWSSVAHRPVAVPYGLITEVGSRALRWVQLGATKLKMERISPWILPRAKKSTDDNDCGPRWWHNFFGLRHWWQLLQRSSGSKTRSPSSLACSSSSTPRSISLERQQKITCDGLLRVLGISSLRIKIQRN